METETENRGRVLERDLELKELPYFCGTEKYYGVWGVRLTEGIKYIMDNGYSWFVTDMIVVLITKAKENEFMTVKLNVKNNKATAKITDGNEKVLHSQEYGYTDAKITEELVLFFRNGVLMLAREY